MRKTLALVLTLMLVMGTMTGFSAFAEESTLQLDFFASDANYQGLQSGWFAKILKEKFNVEVNIIAPNIAGGDTVYQTRAAAGDLGTMAHMRATRMQDCIAAGIMFDMTPYLEDTVYLKNMTSTIEFQKQAMNTEGVYAFPINASFTADIFAPAQIKANAPEYGAYLRWDVYQKIGAPDITDLWQWLDVMADMQAAHPTSDSGSKVYALSLFPDWDGGMIKYVNLMDQMYGTPQHIGFLSVKPDASGYYEWAGKDGLMHETLKWLNTAYHRGLLDPDSATQNFDDLNAKVRDGAVLSTQFPITDYNTAENLAAGKGMILVPVGDMVYSPLGHSPYGQGGWVGLGASVAKMSESEIKRVMALLDWIASPEYASLYYAGPEGLTWELVNGEPTFTEFGKIAVQGEKSNTEVPEEWGGGNYRDGSVRWEFSINYGADTNPLTGEPYNPTLWTSTLTSGRTTVNEQWTERFGTQWPLEAVNAQMDVLPGNPYSVPADSSEIATVRSQCKEVMQAASWQMIYADNEDSFNAIWDAMVEQLNGLGYQDCLTFDLQNLEDYKTVVTPLYTAK